MTDIKISTLVKFLQALEDGPKCVNKVNLRANLTFGTGLRVRDSLLVNDFLERRIKDKRSHDIELTEKGGLLLELLKDIVEA